MYVSAWACALGHNQQRPTVEFGKYNDMFCCEIVSGVCVFVCARTSIFVYGYVCVCSQAALIIQP